MKHYQVGGQGAEVGRAGQRRHRLRHPRRGLGTSARPRLARPHLLDGEQQPALVSELGDAHLLQILHGEAGHLRHAGVALGRQPRLVLLQPQVPQPAGQLTRPQLPPRPTSLAITGLDYYGAVVDIQVTEAS